MTLLSVPGPANLTALGNLPASTDIVPNIFTAVQEQLGLKFGSSKGPVEVLVIDHAEKPS
jgi:uncharacterized protein (TIGR03435 family)